MVTVGCSRVQFPLSSVNCQFSLLFYVVFQFITFICSTKCSDLLGLSEG
jgi:hypothetical protein